MTDKPITPAERAWVERLLVQLENLTIPTYDPPTHCHQCWQQGREILSVRPVCNEGYCSAHLTALYATFGPEAWVDGGVGLQDGPMRPEYGPLEADLRCCCCNATWTGIPGDPCWWCMRSRQIQEEHQIDLLLTPPDVDPDDITYETRMDAWSARMVVGVQAGLITAQQSSTAWHRAVSRKTDIA